MNKPTVSIILKGEKLKAFLQDQEKDKDVHSCHFYSTQFWKSQLWHSEKKKIKGIKIGKEVKLSLFADDMMQYIENPKDATKKLLELINNSVKLLSTKLIYRNMFNFYTLATKCQKEKARQQSHLPLHQKTKIFRNKPS